MLARSVLVVLLVLVVGPAQASATGAGLDPEALAARIANNIRDGKDLAVLADCELLRGRTAGLARGPAFLGTAFASCAIAACRTARADAAEIYVGAISHRDDVLFAATICDAHGISLANPVIGEAMRIRRGSRGHHATVRTATVLALLVLGIVLLRLRGSTAVLHVALGAALLDAIGSMILTRQASSIHWVISLAAGSLAGTLISRRRMHDRAAARSVRIAAPPDAADEARLDEELENLDRKPAKLPRARMVKR